MQLLIISLQDVECQFVTPLDYLCPGGLKIQFNISYNGPSYYILPWFVTCFFSFFQRRRKSLLQLFTKKPLFMQNSIVEMNLINFIFSLSLGPTMTFQLHREQTAGFVPCRSMDITEV